MTMRNDRSGERDERRYDGVHDDPDHASMVRREERLRVDSERVTTGRYHLRKRIVEEERTFTVVVQREDVEVVEEDLSVPPRREAAEPRRDVPAEPRRDAPAEPAPSAGGAPRAAEGAAEAELVLYAQRPVVSFEWVPVERVRLDRSTVVEEHTYTGEVLRERIVAESEPAPGEPPR